MPYKDPEKDREYGRRYYREHREEQREHGRRRYEEHHEERREYGRLYREEHREKAKEYGRLHYKTHREEYLKATKARSQRGGTRQGPWSPVEDEIVVRNDVTLTTIAYMLDRPYGAVRKRRFALNRKAREAA